MFQEDINVKEFSDKLINKTLYNSKISIENNNVLIKIEDIKNEKN